MILACGRDTHTFMYSHTVKFCFVFLIYTFKKKLKRLGAWKVPFSRHHITRNNYRNVVYTIYIFFINNLVAVKKKKSSLA